MTNIVKAKVSRTCANESSLGQASIVPAGDLSPCCLAYMPKQSENSDENIHLLNQVQLQFLEV